MICKITCSVSIIFIVATIWFNFIISDKSNDKMINLLSKKQQEIYSKIKKERLELAINGYGYGLLFSVIIIAINYFTKNNKFKPLSLSCLVGCITFLTQYFYYILSSKTDYMVLHLENKQQRVAWLEIYKKCQYNYHFGLLLGIIGVSLLSYSVKCN